MKKITISKKQNFFCKDEIYSNWYFCTKCNNSYLKISDKFCSECGSKLEWVD